MIPFIMVLEDWYPNGIHNRLGFNEQQGIVDTIYISAEGYEDKSFFYTLWKEYSPEQLIDTYGRPTRIKTMLFGSEQGTVFYYLLLFFDNQGILVSYKGIALSTEKDGQQQSRVCPAWRDHNWLPDMKIYLQSPNRQISLDQVAQVDSKFKSIDEVSQTSVEDFYALIQIDAQPACFETPRSIWR